MVKKIKRAMARQIMLKIGYRHINKKQYDGRSLLAKHWWEYGR